jgi:hypothetical protein
MAKDIGSYFLEQGQPIVPKAKPKQYTIAKEKSQTEEVLDILNTKAAATMLSPRTYTNLVGQTARKAYDQQDISASDYYDIVMPLFGETGEMVTEKIRQYDAELDRYADGGRVKFNAGGSDPKTGQGFQKGNTGFRTKDGEVRNVKGSNQFTPKTPKEIRSIINNPKYSDYTPYRFRNEGILSRTETDKIAPENNIKFKRTGPATADTEKQKNQKVIATKKRVEAIRKNEGLPYSYSGTKTNPKGHASNIYGKNIITPSEIIYTPEKINLTMSGRKGIEKVDKTNPMNALDFKIQQTEKQIEDIKKSNMSSAKKKTELAKLDNKLVNYVSKSGGYKIATLSDNTKYGKTFQGLKSLDMFDEFEGKSEKEMNDFIKKYKNMKVGKTTTQADKDNIVKAKIAAENIKFAKQNAAKSKSAPIRIDPGSLKPGALSPRMKLFRFSKGGPVYGKYAKQIAKISS